MCARKSLEGILRADMKNAQPVLSCQRWKKIALHRCSEHHAIQNIEKWIVNHTIKKRILF